MVIIRSKKENKNRDTEDQRRRKKKTPHEQVKKRSLYISSKCSSTAQLFSPPFLVPLFVSDVVTSSPIRAGSAHFVAHIWSQNCRSVARRNLRRPWSPWLQTGCSLSGLYGHWKGDEKGIQRKYLPLFRSVLCVRS